MKENILAPIIEEAIRLEQNIARLYIIFRDANPADYQFWDDLVHEEENHALLIDGIKDFVDDSPSLRQITPASLEEIQKSNNYVKTLIIKYRAAPPERKKALDVAAEIEQSAGELHYQKAMEMPSDSKMLTVFQNLNGEDLDHLKRIKEYASQI